MIYLSLRGFKISGEEENLNAVECSLPFRHQGKKGE